MKRAKTSLLLSLILTAGLGTIAIAARYSTITTARGRDVLTREVVQTFGGVVLQGTTEFYDDSKREISPRSLTLRLDKQTNESEKICVVYKTTCYGIEMSSEIAVPLATWVFSGQTGAFTAWNPYESNEEEAQGPLRRFQFQFYDPYEGKMKWLGGFLPAELAQGVIPVILTFIDYVIALEKVDDSEIKQNYNKRLGSNFDPSSHQLDPKVHENPSYLMTDIDTKYEAQLIDKQVQLTGLIYQYNWELYKGVEYPYITEVNRACTPASIKATDNENCSLVDLGIPQVVEGVYQMQKQALLLAQITAVFRTFADDNCEESSRFVRANNLNYDFPTNQCEKLTELAEEAQSN